MNLYGKFTIFIVVSIVLAIITLAFFLWTSGVQRPMEFLSRVRFPIDSNLIIGAVVVVVILVIGLIFYVKERVLRTG
jgi:hypothetical protein